MKKIIFFVFIIIFGCNYNPFNESDPNAFYVLLWVSDDKDMGTSSETSSESEKDKDKDMETFSEDECLLQCAQCEGEEDCLKGQACIKNTCVWVEGNCLFDSNCIEQGLIGKKCQDGKCI